MNATMELLREKLEKSINPLQLRILDESSHHAGHMGAREGGESHFRLEIVAHAFTGLSRVQRHRLIYDAIGTAFAEGLHALQITARAPGE